MHINPRKDVHIFAVVLRNSFFKQNLPILKELFEKSIRAHQGVYPIIDLQAELLSFIIVADEARRKYLRWKSLFGKALKRLAENGAPRERLRRAIARIEDMERCAEAAKIFVSQLRSIGDGIAWRFFNYDRAVLRLLSEHEPVSAPQWSTGLIAELNEVQCQIERGYPVLLNSITNFLRVGDITIFDKTAGSFNLVEVKAGGKKTSRTVRQRKYMELVQDGLDEGSHSIAGVRITKLMAEAPLTTYVKSVENAMVEAEQNFVSSRLFGEYLALGVFAARKIIDDLSENQMQGILRSVNQRCRLVKRRRSDILLSLMSNIFATVRFSPILAPYAVFPIHTNRRFDLLSGDFWIVSHINISGLARWLEKRGWKTKSIPLPTEASDVDQFAYLPVLQVWKGNKGVELPLDVLAVAAMEFWMPDAIEATVISMFNQAIPHEGLYQVNFRNKGKCALD